MKNPTLQSKSTTGSAAKPMHVAVPAKPAIFAEPAHDDIARRAYEIYLARGCADGQDVQDWIQAERELRKQAMTAGRPRIS